jgi:hypothetical protein
MDKTYKILLSISQAMFTKKQFQLLIETMQLYHFTDEQWNNWKTILIDNKDGFTDDQWKMVYHLLNENRLNDEQFGIFVDMLDNSTQKFVLLHAGGGTGKTFVTCKIFEELARQNEIFCCTCPTRVGTLHLPQGQTFHSVFKTCERICPSGGSIGRIWSRFGVGVRSFSWNWSVRNGRVLGESSVYFRKASRRFSTGQEWDWHAPDAC